MHHDFGGDFRHSRNSKAETREQVKGTMSSTRRRGLDYTPLFKFLLSKVGQNWDDVFQEAQTRLDKVDPIFWIVSIDADEPKEFVRTGESSYFSGMLVDDDRILQLTNPTLTANDLEPFCTCCTHTFNGKLFGRKKKG